MDGRTEFLNAPHEVPLIDADLIWSPYTGEVRIERWPTRERARLSEGERLRRLIYGAWNAVIRDGIDPHAIHDALCVVPEYAECMTRDRGVLIVRDDE